MIYFELNGEKAVITWQYETITREIAGHGVRSTTRTTLFLKDGGNNVIDEVSVVLKNGEADDKSTARKFSLEKLLYRDMGDASYTREERATIWKAYNNRMQYNKLRNKNAPIG